MFEDEDDDEYSGLLTTMPVNTESDPKPNSE